MPTDPGLPDLLQRAAGRVRGVQVPLVENAAYTTTARMSLLFQWTGVSSDRDGDQVDALIRKYKSAQTALEHLASRLDQSAAKALEQLAIEAAEKLAAEIKAAEQRAKALAAAAQAAQATKKR